MATAFVMQNVTTAKRRAQDPAIFDKSDWDKLRDAELRKWVLACFDAKVRALIFNNGLVTDSVRIFSHRIPHINTNIEYEAEGFLTSN
jgi:hypothetical protein